MKTRTIDFKFSKKHKQYMKKALSCSINVAEGAVRAGKTVDNVFCFAYLLEKSPDKLHLATGSTASNALINIGDCNGMGLEHIFRGRCRYIKYKGCQALKIDTAVGERIVLFAGAAKADSYKKIRGNSYGMWIATEINLHHTSTIKEAFNRQLAAKKRKIFWDLNPDNPNSFIYKEFLDVYEKKQLSGEMLGGYNYEHFTIYDNKAVPRERLEEIVSQYDKRSVWYRRDILGERCVAEGLIYPSFCEKQIIDLGDSKKRGQFCKSIEHIEIGVDFGGNRSLTTFVATAIHRNRNEITVLQDGCIKGAKGEIDPERVNREIYAFIMKVLSLYPGVKINAVHPDCAEQYLISGLRGYLAKRLPTVAVVESIKRPIIDRIRSLNSLIARDKFHIERDCALTIDGIRNAHWDVKSKESGLDRRADDFSSDIDIMDALEYSYEMYIDSLSFSHTDIKSVGKGGLYAEDFKGGWS